MIDDEAHHVEVGGGYLTLTRPWPGMLRGIWGDPERYKETYWSEYEGRYFAGDGCRIDADGYLKLSDFGLCRPLFGDRRRDSMGGPPRASDSFNAPSK